MSMYQSTDHQQTKRRSKKRDFTLNPPPQAKLKGNPQSEGRFKVRKFHFLLLGLLVASLVFALTELLPWQEALAALNALPDPSLLFRILISVSAGLLATAFLLWLRSAEIIRQVNILCREFLAYRRRHESTDLEELQGRQPRSDIEWRVGILQEVWPRFQSMQKQLSQHVRELGDSKQELETTVTNLQQAKEQERRFVELGYAVAEFGHDIGNANGSILTFSSLLLQQLNKESVSSMDLVRALSFIRRIEHSSVNIKGLTRDILEVARGIELHSEAIDLENFQSELDTHLGFVVHPVVVEYLFPSDPDFSFSADSRKLVRVIVNLVKNAWEKLLDDESGLIEISFVPDHTDLVIRVYDNGSPIPESVLPNLFQAFQTEGKLDGTGLGLAISQRMVELHGGTIQVENCPEDQGVFFEIRLPGCVPTKRVAEKRVA